MRKIYVIIFFSALFVHASASDTAAVKKNILKINLLTPLNFDPSYELAYERTISSWLGFEVAFGFIKGNGLNKLDEALLDYYYSPYGIEHGYRIVAGPKFYRRRGNSVHQRALYLSPVLTIKQTFEEYTVSFDVWRGPPVASDNISAPAKYKKESVDISFRTGYLTKGRLTLDAYIGLGFRITHRIEEIDLDLGNYEYFQRMWPGRIDFNKKSNAGPTVESYRPWISVPAGIKLGYRF